MNTPLLALRGVTKIYPATGLPARGIRAAGSALRPTDLVLAAGNSVGLVGESAAAR
jgi:ABC-type glutathione transport system ATPase component